MRSSWNQPSKNWNFRENIIAPFSTIDNAMTVELCLVTTLVSVYTTLIFYFIRLKIDKIRRQTKSLKFFRKQ